MAISIAVSLSPRPRKGMLLPQAPVVEKEQAPSLISIRRGSQDRESTGTGYRTANTGTP